MVRGAAVRWGKPCLTSHAGYVVTSGGRGVGRAIVGRLLSDGAHVAVIELEESTMDWVAGHALASA